MSREDFSSTGTGMGAPGARCSWQKADKHIYAEHQKTELLQPVSELLFLHAFYNSYCMCVQHCMRMRQKKSKALT